MDGATSLALENQETEERETISCPVCKGSGNILKSELLKAFGGSTLKAVLEGGMEEFIKKLNLGGLEVFRRIHDEEESKWKEKIAALEMQSSQLTATLQQKEREIADKEKLAAERGNLEAQKRAEQEKTELTKQLVELKAKINNLEEGHKNEADKINLDHRREVEGFQKRLEEMQEKEKELIVLRERLPRFLQKKGKQVRSSSKIFVPNSQKLNARISWISKEITSLKLETSIRKAIGWL